MFTQTALLSASVAAVLSLAACATNDRSSAEEGSVAAQQTSTAQCPVCGMATVDGHPVYADGREALCCSQECADKFNSASMTSKRAMLNKETAGRDTGRSGAVLFTPSSNGSTTVTMDGQEYAQENMYDPVTGKQLDGQHYYAIIDGHRLDFASKSDAERYAAMNYEQRMQTRLAAR